jgi:hypothetical protein
VHLRVPVVDGHAWTGHDRDVAGAGEAAVLLERRDLLEAPDVALAAVEPGGR